MMSSHIKGYPLLVYFAHRQFVRFGFFSGPSSPEPWHPLWYRILSPPLFCHLICTQLCKQKKKNMKKSKLSIIYLSIIKARYKRKYCRLCVATSWQWLVSIELWMSTIEEDEAYPLSCNLPLSTLMYWSVNSLQTCVTSLILLFYNALVIHAGIQASLHAYQMLSTVCDLYYRIWPTEYV